MTNKTSTLSAKTKAVIAAVILGTTISMTSGAQANHNFNGSFSLNFGNGVHLGFSNGIHNQFHFGNRARHRFGCMTIPQVRHGLHRLGFRKFKVINNQRRFAKVKATRNHRRYTIRVNKCNGKMTVLARKRIRR